MVMVADPVVGFVPPPYPYDRLRALERLADSLLGGVVDCSIGTPCDPVPEIEARAAAAALPSSMGYPASAGSAALRHAAAAWIGRRFGVAIDGEHVGACVGTKELVASLPHLLRLRNPERDTVLFPAVAYPSYEMGAILGGCRAVPVALDAQWHLDLSTVSDADAERALVLWVNEPGNPTSSVGSSSHLAEVATWARERGIVTASDECYAEFAPEPATILEGGLGGVLAMHSLSKRSNLAGMRIGFYAGDVDLVSYLVEARKHAGLMVPAPMQAAAVAALGDDDHVAVQRNRYAERRALALDALAPLGLVHDGGPCSFYLWLRREGSADDGWEIAAELSQKAGLLVAPGDLYGPVGADHVRLALVQPRERLELAFDRLTGHETARSTQ
jgi:succinyldiaminopimelate transaminase